MITNWVLVIYIYVGMLGSGNNMTMTNIGGFHSKESCEAAGQQSEALVKNFLNSSRFICVEVR
jgi:hypothetical protein